MKVNRLQKEAWQRLVDGQSLDSASLPKKNGRIDLGGLVLPKLQVIERLQTKFAEVAKIEPGPVFRKVKWQDLDFSGSKLDSLQFWDSEIVNCCFDRCRMRDLQPSVTKFHDCSFQGTDLTGSGLGIPTPTGTSTYGRNAFVGVDFSEADLRDTHYIAGAFERCSFRQTKLLKLNFASSRFVDCWFEGELREIQFWRSDLFTRPWLPQDAFPINEMANCDFSRASLRDVEFRGIDLTHVALPEDANHIIIQDYAETLERFIQALRQDCDQTARILIAVFEVGRKWAAPHSRGVLNKLDLAEAGDDAVERVMSLLATIKGRVH